MYLSGCCGLYCVVDVGGIFVCFRRNSVKKFAETTSFALQEPAATCPWLSVQCERIGEKS